MSPAPALPALEMDSEETHLAPTRPIPPNFSHKILSVNSGEASWHDENRFRVLAASRYLQRGYWEDVPTARKRSTTGGPTFSRTGRPPPFGSGWTT